MTASGRIIAAVADWEGVNQPSKINDLTVANIQIWPHCFVRGIF
jgi:hypothetical protein